MPAYESDYEKAKKLKVGETVRCEITKPRNIKFHRKFMALINLVFQNQSQYNDFDRLRKDLTIEAGYYDEWVNLHGAIEREAKSISFANMDDLEFGELYNSLLDVIVKYFHFDKIEIEENLSEFY